MRVLLLALLLAGLCLCADVQPVVGILTLSDDDAQPELSSFPASYVKWLEGAGARVIPLYYSMPFEEMHTILDQLDGVLFTGGTQLISFHPINPFSAAGQYVFNYAMDNNMPLWGIPWTTTCRCGAPALGTCLGFELISCILLDDNVLKATDAYNITMPVEITECGKSTRMYSSQPHSEQTQSDFLSLPLSTNTHNWGIYPEQVEVPAFDDFCIASYNTDRVGQRFVSSYEHKTKPIFATQYHPEKSIYEWSTDVAINHSHAAVQAMQSLAMAFVDECRKYTHVFQDQAWLDDNLIYGYSPEYTGLNGSHFEQQYYFSDDVYIK
ncbi:peptidase C26, gamma-glutamyl hydrolase [Kipferlia bialata]|uniref:folate gamma-glutamyl hydrolase n=1 Tax=Kipferlia bialata TaxID=797122 RepID=A0A9K3CZV8_9EUKA|nr:peptidase C26, gamma-glutamyl hydrolase [Kipferlia bialata]|eukprot:g8368.t1